MPKNKETRRRIRERRARKRHSHRLARMILARERRASSKGQVTARSSKPATLFAPAVFELYDRNFRKDVITFLKRLRDITVKQERVVVVDFSKTRRMVSCGTLLLLAETKRIAMLTSRRAIRCRRVRDATVNQVLQQIGFYGAIGRRSSVSPTAEDVIHWSAVTGQGAEGEKAGRLVETVGNRLPASLGSPMYDGLVEAMTNCVQHAHLARRRDGLGYRGNGEWWMFAKEQEGNLVVVFCDLGIGIPNSLPLTQGQGRVRELLAELGRAAGLAYRDSDLVRAAVESGRSRTREAHRGKGLRDVLDVINTAKNGMIQIFSNSGCFTYRVRDGVATQDHRNYSHSILGTLIQWLVPIRLEDVT